MPNAQGSPHPLRHKFSGPGIPRGVLSRSRLDRHLAELFDAYSVVEIVSAPGSGKTVQAQLYAAQADRTLAWLTLDRRDQSATGLVFDLATALEGVVEDAVATTRRALVGEEKPEEAAAILASAAGSADCLLVIDECQQISTAVDAAAALDTFLEYIPETMHVLLLAREELPWPLQKRYVHGQIAQIGQSTMDLTPDETAELVCRLTGSAAHSERIFASTGGWAAGVALACRFAGEQEPDPRDLSTYLRRQVLDPLPPDEQAFLLDTSVADVVTAEVATALCGADGARLFTAVLARHLPATSTAGGTIRYHSLFRTFLQTRLIEVGAGRHLDRNRAYAAHLASLRQFEEATEVLFSIGDREGAYRMAVQALPALYAHANWPVVIHWLDLLGEERGRDDPVLIGAQIRAIHGRREFDDARALVRRLDREGRLRAALTADPSLVATAAWALQSYPREVLTLLDKYEGDQCAEVVRYMTETIVGTRPATQPIVDDVGEVERLLTWALFVQGRLADLEAREVADSERPVLNPNVVLAPALRGQADIARALWLRVPAEIRTRPHSRFIEALLDLATGDRAKAMEHLRLAQTDSQRSGFSLGPVYQIFIGYVLVLNESVDAAEAAIDHLIPLLDAMSQSGQTAYVEWTQCFLGVAYLKSGRNTEALYILREVVASMTRSQRRLLLSLAAAALSEAEARAGDEQAAHEAAQLAHHVAQLTSSFALLVQAVRLFPDVQRREIAHNPQDSRWRRLVVSPSARPRHEASGSTLATPRPEPVGATDGMVLRIQPFGHDRDLFLDGVPAHIGRIKILELVALIALHPGGIDRFLLQQRLFPESDQRSGGNHFRQIAHKLRRSTGVALARNESLITMPDTVSLVADDIECERLFSAASAVTGAERLELLRKALDMATGSYLDGSTLTWAEERRHHLDVVREEARLELAALYLEAGQPDKARAECEAVLAANRFSDPAHRLSVEIERRVGSESAAIAAYRRAAEALAELGLRPGDARRMLRGPGAPRKPAATSPRT